MTNAIETNELRFSYVGHEVLQGINLSVPKGAIACITGENGCGKSTLLKLLVGAVKPSSGTCEVFGLPAADGRQLRRVGYVPQATSTEKVSFPITARELVVQGLGREFGWLRIPRKHHYIIADDQLDRMGLGNYKNVPFSELSGGLQQRVLITRALVHNPELIFLDEPTSGVDVESRTQFLADLEHLHHERSLTVVIVTHNLDEVSRHLPVDHVYRITEGTLADVAVAC